MGDRVMPYLKLDSTWKSRIIAVLRSDEPPQDDRGQGERLRRALENLRKQHQWGNIYGDEYRTEREALVWQVFLRITIDGKDLVDIEPKPEYAPFLPPWSRHKK